MPLICSPDFMLRVDTDRLHVADIADARLEVATTATIRRRYLQTSSLPGLILRRYLQTSSLPGLIRRRYLQTPPLPGLVRRRYLVHIDAIFSICRCQNVGGHMH